MNPRWIGGMSVADGTPSCKGVPPVPKSTGISKASVKHCAGAVGGSMCTGWKCAKHVKSPTPSGSIQCVKGKWVFKGRHPKTKVSCHPPKPAKSVVDKNGKKKRLPGKCEEISVSCKNTVLTSV